MLPSLEAFCPPTLVVPALLLVSWALSVTKHRISQALMSCSCENAGPDSAVLGGAWGPVFFYELQVRPKLLGHRPHLEQCGSNTCSFPFLTSYIHELLLCLIFSSWWTANRFSFLRVIVLVPADNFFGLNCPCPSHLLILCLLAPLDVSRCNC